MKKTITAILKIKIFVKSKHDIYKSKVPGAHNISSKSGYGIKNLLNKIVRKTYSDTINEPTFFTKDIWKA